MRFRLLSYPLVMLAAARVLLGKPITNPNAPVSQQKLAKYYAALPRAQVNHIFLPPIVPLGQEQTVALEFDVLGEQALRLTAKLNGSAASTPKAAPKPDPKAETTPSTKGQRQLKRPRRTRKKPCAN